MILYNFPANLWIDKLIAEGCLHIYILQTY